MMHHNVGVGTQKPDGLSIWRPEDMPKPLVKLPLEDIPGIGKRMEERLNKAGITTMDALLATQPKQLRAIWRNVTGERLWYRAAGCRGLGNSGIWRATSLAGWWLSRAAVHRQTIRRSV